MAKKLSEEIRTILVIHRAQAMLKVAGPEPAKDQQSKDWAISTGVKVRSKKTTAASATDWNRLKADIHSTKVIGPL